MVEDSLNDTNYIYPEDSIALVKAYFKEKLSSYNLIKKSLYTGYWGIEYSNENIAIFFDGDIGGHFTVYIIIDNKKIPLWQYNRNILNTTYTTKKNILYVLSVIKEFLEENNTK